MSGPTPDKARHGLPERWLYCPKMGQIVDDLFIPFKTPLCGLYDDQIEEVRHRFHPEDVFKAPQLKGKKIGLWCDFTKTDRFYFVHEVEKYGCQYKKIKMEGFGASPSKEQVEEFIKVVQKFVRENPGKLIGVHCTHGFNRTGFAISSYLVTVKDMAVDYAVQLFASFRPCGIYKQDYINDLFERYGDMEDCVEAPPKPGWEFDEDTSADFTTMGSSKAQFNKGDKPGSSKKLFMDGLIENVTWVDDYSKKEMLRGKIKDLCMARRDGFPGLQPISLRQNNIQTLAENKYLVSWKADGMRYMVYILDQDEVYAFDRDNEAFFIEGLDFRHRKEPHRSVRNVLVDTEVIIDKHMVDGREVASPRMLIYDIIQFEDLHIGKENYNLRRSCIDNELIRPRKNLMMAGKLRQQPMSVRIKDFWELEAVPKLFTPKFTKSIGHEIDGLIFQPTDPPYTAGRCDKVFKWKPPSHNSVDFLLNIRKEQRPGFLAEWWGYLYVQHRAEPVERMKATKTLQKYDNKIIECTLDLQKREWVFMRERTDKSLANAYSTYENVLDSMLNPITQEGLIQFVMTRCVRRKPHGHGQGHGGHGNGHGHQSQPPSKRPRTD